MPARAYIRVSSAEQARGTLTMTPTTDKERARLERSGGVSLETQRAKITEYAQRNNLMIAAWYQDVLSGTREDRPQYQQMLRDLQPGETLLVARMDRIGRKNSERFRLFEWCNERQIQIVSVTQPELSNRMARDFLTIIDAYAIEELRARVIPGMVTQAEKGRWLGRTPRWYIIGSDGHLEPTEDSTDAQRAFDLFLATRNVEATAVAFDADTTSMRQWLMNRVYIGESHWGGIIVPHAHPAIVKEETFAAVQAILSARTRTGRREPYGTSLLTGFLYVKDTDRRLYFHRDKRTLRTWYATQSTQGWLPRYSVSAPLADEYAIDQLASLTITTEERREIERAIRMRLRDDPDKRRRAALVRKREVLLKEQLSTDRMRARGEIDGARYARMQQEQQRDIQAIEMQLLSLPSMPDPSSIAPLLDLRSHLGDDVRAAWERRDVRRLRGLVEAFIARIEVESEPTEGKIGMAAAYWRAHPPAFSVRWNEGVFVP